MLGFPLLFVTQRDSCAKQKTLSGTALLWFFWQFAEFGACHRLIIVSCCRDWIVYICPRFYMFGSGRGEGNGDWP